MGLMSKVTDTVGLTDTKGAKEAANQASKAQREALKSARQKLRTGSFRAGELITGGERSARQLIRQGASAQELGLNRALGELDDLAQIGMSGERSLRRFERGSTPQGFADNIRFLSESGVLDPLIAEQTQAAQSALASSGLTRSQGGIQELGEIPISTLLGIEGSLADRQLGTARLALPAAMGAATGRSNLQSQIGGVRGQMFGNLGSSMLRQTRGLADLSSNLAANMANLTTGMGEIEANRILSVQKAQQRPGELFHEAGLAYMEGLGQTYSDRRLKTNIIKIGNISDINIYMWDWIIPMFAPVVGCISDEVKKLYPDCVISGVYDKVDYKKLAQKLR